MIGSGRRAGKPRLELEQFRLLRDLINDAAGLHFDDDSQYLFERRLAERLVQLECPGFDDYYMLLRFGSRGAAELDEAIERLSTKETYLFRQEYQLASFEQEVLPKLHKELGQRRQLVVWSAGCSTGEEAYTLAIIIHRTGLFEGWDVRVIGSDLSKRNVAAARRGIYRESSFRTTPAEVRRAYFSETPEGWAVQEQVRRLCHFAQLNLLDAARAAIVGRVHVVFCRNVLIYFDIGSRKKAIDNFYERLAPGGYLLLGHSESLLNLSTAFELVHLERDLAYRKPLAAWRWDSGAT